MRFTLCKAPNGHETRPDHNTKNYMPYSFFDTSPAKKCNTEDAGDSVYGLSFYEVHQIVQSTCWQLGNTFLFSVGHIGTVCDFRLSYGRVLNRKSKIIAVNRNKSQLFKVNYNIVLFVNILF